MSHVSEFARALPKAELHIHIEGSIEPELMFELARRNGIRLPYGSLAALRSAYDFSSLQDFLDLYYRGMGVLRTERDFHDLTAAYLDRAAADGVVRAEIFFDPQGHLSRGVDFETVLDGILRATGEAEARHGLGADLIMCFLRHLDEDEAERTLDLALPHKGRIIGVGLDSSEVGHPPGKFKNVFRRARDEGFRLVAHAGEEGPPEYVWESLDVLGVERIDHGNRALEDQALVRRLVSDRVPLTVCPLSNKCLKVVKDMADHPLRRMLDAGLHATVNSDDPAYFGGYVNANFEAVDAALGLTREEVLTLVRNSFAAAFNDEQAKAEAIALLDAAAAATPDLDPQAPSVANEDRFAGGRSTGIGSMS